MLLFGGEDVCAHSAERKLYMAWIEASRSERTS